MSMFSGFTNQISGLLAKGKGEEGGEVDPNAVAEGGVAAAPQEAAAVENGAEGVEGAEGQGAGGMSGLAQGLMMKAMTAKDGLKEKASTFQPPNLGGMGGSLMQNVTNLIPGRREEDVPTPPEPNPPSEIGGEMLEGEEVIQE